MPLHKSVICLFLLPGTKNENSVIKCQIALIIWYSRGRQAGGCLWDILERTCQEKFLVVKYCVHVIGRVKTAMEFRMK